MSEMLYTDIPTCIFWLTSREICFYDFNGFPRSTEVDRSIFMDQWRIGSRCTHAIQTYLISLVHSSKYNLRIRQFIIDQISELDHTRSINIDRSMTDWIRMHSMRFDRSELVGAPLKVQFENPSNIDGFPRSIELDRSILTDRWRIRSGCIPCDSDGSELVAHVPWRVLRTHPCSAGMPQVVTTMVDGVWSR